MPTERWDTPIPTVPDRFVYRLRSTEAGSAKFGPCEVCGKHVSEIFMQIEGRTYAIEEADIKDFLETNWGQHTDLESPLAITRNGCKSYFGHPECLLGKRR